MARYVSLGLSNVEQLFISRNRKVAAPSSRWGKAGVTLLAMVAGGFIMISALWAWGNLQQVNLNYQISRAKERQKEYRELNDKLRIELSSLTAISRLEKEAETKFGMGPPQPCQVVRLP